MQREASSFGNTTPAVGDGFVVVSSGVLTALDALTGELLWEFDPDVLGGLAAPLIPGDRIYVASVVDGWLFALDRTNGVLLGVFALAVDLNLKAPAAQGQVVFLAGKNRTLYAFDMSKP
jgi:outer membrane protein assembly factor BamB